MRRWLIVEGETVPLATVVSLDNSNTLTASTVTLDVGLEVGDNVEEASSSSTRTEGFAVVDATSSVAVVVALGERCCRLGASVVVGIDDGETLGLSEG